jgi:S1-C subfamily serine protease
LNYRRNNTPNCALPHAFILLTALLALLNSGCNFRQNQITRTTSFNPHVGRQINQVDITTFLSSRVVLLASNDQPLAQLLTNGTPELPPRINLGCAAAIDPRGYFLTAAHNLKHPMVELFRISSPKTFSIVPARVVWKASDVAILHVQYTLDQTFDWATEIQKHDPVIAVGLSWTEKDLNGFELMGGKIFRHTMPKGEAGILEVASDVPVQSGDSGGPLVDSEGRLIGINVRATPPFFQHLFSKRAFPTIAQRPDPKWLAGIIEKDAATRLSPGNP